ncbi:MAG: site-2 protease family protein [Spirochaetota bacterium]
MIVVNILIGLVGLGFVVFIHELGHMLAAKAVGIEVEAFSLGWGRKLVGFTWRGTEYRISVFPVGGYCKMKGEQSYAQALEEERDTIPQEAGSFFGASPWRRIVTLLAGPIANIVLAVIILTIVWWVGFSIESYENRIVLATDYETTALAQGAETSNERAPADLAGLETGDVIVAIDDKSVRSYGEIQQTVAQNALTELDFTVERDGRPLEIPITPRLVPETGSGFIGVYPWVDPVVESVAPGSRAASAGLQDGDRIVSVNGEPVPHVWEFRRLLEQAEASATITVSRDGSRVTLSVPAELEDLNREISFETLTLPTPDYNLFQAVGRGAAESVRILVVSVRSLRLLFQGVELTSAVAGPVRISYFIGDVATSGFQVGLATGLRSLANFLALLSVVLFFMNLLPIPVLDGGQIVLALVEWLRGRSSHPRTIYRYQMIGSILVFALLFFALFGDILFLAGR